MAPQDSQSPTPIKPINEPVEELIQEIRDVAARYELDFETALQVYELQSSQKRNKQMLGLQQSLLNRLDK
jgi:hypothetical protein